jgi:hypothetical protein
MAKAVRSVRPGAAILLVWDCAPVHLSVKVLETAKRVGVSVVFIPGRMTWALQPLDTHVFAQLKHAIRTKQFEAKAATSSSALPPGQRIRLHGDAINEILVDRSWTAVMERAGLSCTSAALRPALSELLENRNVEAAFPADDELLEILAVRPDRLPDFKRLLRPVLTPADDASGGAPSASGASAATVRAAPGRGSAGPKPIVLNLRARLPSAPSRPACENVWLPFFAGRSVQTRSMSAAAAAATGESQTSAASVAPAKRARTQRL